MTSTTVSVHRAHKASAEPPASSPSSCVLDLWEQGIERYAICADALARLIIAQPKRINTFADPAVVERALRETLKKNLASFGSSKPAFWISAIVQFLEFAGRGGEAVGFYHQAIANMKSGYGPAHPETHAVAQEMCQFLRRCGREKEAFAVHYELQAGRLLASGQDGALSQLRELAYEAFVNGCLTEAETTYRQLLLRHFELPGTCCHLARVLILLGRDIEARALVNTAWESRAQTEPYTVGRILFLKALLATLVGEDADEPLVMLKAILQQNPGAKNPWRMAPVLDHVQPRLTPKSLAFFSQLVRAMSGDAAE
jgi:hypothetical protein